MASNIPSTGSNVPSTGILNTNAPPFTTFTLAQVENMYSTLLAGKRGQCIRLMELENKYKSLPRCSGSILEMRTIRDRIRLGYVVLGKFRREIDAWERQLRRRWIMKDNRQAGWDGI